MGDGREGRRLCAVRPGELALVYNARQKSWLIVSLSEGKVVGIAGTWREAVLKEVELINSAVEVGVLELLDGREDRGGRIVSGAHLFVLGNVAAGGRCLEYEVGSERTRGASYQVWVGGVRGRGGCTCPDWTYGRDVLPMLLIDGRYVGCCKHMVAVYLWRAYEDSLKGGCDVVV